MPKYKNYAELAAAFKSGELKKGYYLMLDKSGTENSLSFYDSALTDSENEILQDGCRELFDGDNQKIESAFDALGIPNEWC